jgi:hypothetical protein
MNKIEIPMLKKWRPRIIFSFNIWDISVHSDDMVGIYFCAWLVKRSKYALLGCNLIVFEGDDVILCLNKLTNHNFVIVFW